LMSGVIRGKCCKTRPKVEPELQPIFENQDRPARAALAADGLLGFHVVEFCLHLGNASELDIESMLHRFDHMFELPDPLSICGWRAVSPYQAGADGTSLIGG
jgi:hypothetical protein